MGIDRFMHIPDGFLSTPVWASLDLAAAPAAVLIARRARIGVDDGQAPLLGVMGAFVFAAQMINFPVGLGTSGHLVGAALLMISLGPAAASAVMTAILAVQAFVFQDGGVLALGANVFNMAIAGTLAAYAPVYFFREGRFRTVGVALGAFLSVAVSATLALGELLISGIRMPGAALMTSFGLFAAGGVIEAAITVAVVRALERLHPRFVAAPRRAVSRPLAALGIAAVLLAGIGVLFASSAPDALEALVAHAGSGSSAKGILPSLMPDYQLPVGGPEWIRRVSAGLAGIAVMALVSLGLVRLLSRRGAGAGGGA